MTAREQLVAWLVANGFTYHESGTSIILGYAADWPDTPTVTHVGTKPDTRDETGGVGGYSGFFASFDFDEAGNAIKIGVWE